MADYTRVVDTASLITSVHPNDSVSVVNARLGRGSASSAASGRTVWLKRLSVFQLVLAILLLITGFICFMDSHVIRRPEHTCVMGTGGWTSILYVVCSSLGIAATCSQKRRPCLFVSYFVLLIVGASLNGILVLVSAVYLIQANNRTITRPSDEILLSEMEYTHYSGRLHAKAVAIWYNAILVALSAAHLISIVASASIMCSLMSKTGGCCGGGQDEGETTVLYVSPPEGSGGQPQIIVLPKNLNGDQPVTIQMKLMAPNEHFLHAE